VVFSRLSDLYPCCHNALPGYLGYIWPDMFGHKEKMLEVEMERVYRQGGGIVKPLMICQTIPGV